MFSEYASRFLQQSNARLSFTQQDDRRRNSRNPSDRQRPGPSSSSRYVQRPGMQPNPYRTASPSQSRFPFASRLARPEPQAPLFYSATDDYREEYDNEEHEREVADLYALQRSRQQFRQSNLTESSELEYDDTERLEEVMTGQDHDRNMDTQRGRVGLAKSPSRTDSVPESDGSGPSSKGTIKLVDVNLNSTIHEDPSESLANIPPSEDPEDPPPPFRTFNAASKSGRHGEFMTMETDDDSRLDMAPPASDRESAPPTVVLPSPQPPKHDALWASLFQISFFSMFAFFALVWLQTSTPTSSNPLGDTIYSALRSSTNMLLWDTVLAVIVALVWLSLLRNYVRVLAFFLLVAVPIVLTAFSLYPLISSFKGPYDGASYQDRAMRWLSFIPAIMAFFWTWSVITHRYSLSHAISILEFSTKVLSASPYLIILGFATLGTVVVFTWVWMLMFERIFLSGHFSGAKKFIIDANSWWLGIFFVLQYLWTLGVIAGVQRAATAATVSQWYFHRFASPQPTSREVVKASFNHAIGALFGTVCLSTLLSLMVRLPLIVLPGRISGVLNLCAYWIIPTSLATLTNPLTLTYAAIHSQPLGIASRGLGQLNFVSKTNPSNTLGPRNFSAASGRSGSALIPYRLSKLLLQATRWIMSFALGFGGWVRTARSLQIDGAPSGIRGSVYAYVVGLIAGTIGFAVLGAVENVVGAVVDAVVICWASESAGGRAEAKFCREAGELFGDEGGYFRRSGLNIA